MSKKLLFRVTEKDLIVQTFHAGGPGGQNQNKRETGVRITHPKSGAVGEARDSRSQKDNKREALRRMTETREFKVWVNKIVYEMDSSESIEQVVDRMMKPENLTIEGVDEKTGKWVKLEGE